jgi:hypothetical protein
MADNVNPLTEQINSLIKEKINPRDIVRRYEHAKRERIPWDTKWQMIQDQVFPDYRNYSGRSRNILQPQTSKIKNHSGIISGKIHKTVSMISSGLTDPSVKWMDLKLGIRNFRDNEDTAKWLYYCQEELYDLFADPESNFYSSTFELHFDWFTLGTACREIILRKDTGNIQFNTVSMQNICAEQSGYGDLTTIFRIFNVTANQAFDLWGDKIHPTQLGLVQSGKSEAGNVRKFEYIETSFPNPVYGMHPAVLPYITVVIDKTNKHIVDIGMNHQPPYVISRFFVAPGEIYGRSHVWNAMPDILSINRVSKRILQGIDFAIFPVNLVKDETSIIQNQITPGAFIPGIDHNGNATIRQLPPFANPQVGTDFYNMKVAELDDGLIARDIFPAESPNMTATEVNERKIQANNRLRPVLIRLEHEDLNKTIRRSLKLLEQSGRLPPFPYDKLQISPEELPDPIMSLRVRFSGQLAKMQKLQEIVNNDLIFQKLMQAGQIDPTVFDRFVTDELIKEDAKIYGISPSIMRSDEEAEQIREQRSAEQERQRSEQEESMKIDNILKLKEAGIDVGRIAQI